MPTLPRVALILTGGTIDSVGKDRLDLAWYIEAGKRLGDGELLQQLPELKSIAQVAEIPFRRLPSHALVDKDWLDLVRTIHSIFDQDKADGVVITHGTNTIEETAYFLNLVLKTDKPVVVVGSMRPSSAISADGYLNVVNAIKVAADPSSRGRGCLLVTRVEQEGARDVTRRIDIAELRVIRQLARPRHVTDRREELILHDGTEQNVGTEALRVCEHLLTQRGRGARDCPTTKNSPSRQPEPPDVPRFVEVKQSRRVVGRIDLRGMTEGRQGRRRTPARRAAGLPAIELAREDVSRERLWRPGCAAFEHDQALGSRAGLPSSRRTPRPRRRQPRTGCRSRAITLGGEFRGRVASR